MSELALVRPDDWNLPLFVHVLGAFTLIGALVMAASFLFSARRDGSVELTRMGFRSLLIVALPALIVTRLAAQWIASKEDLEDSELAWIEIGFMSTDVGLLVLLAATIAAGLAVRRAGGAATADGAGGGGATLAAWLVMLLIATYGVVTWLMATKPA
jgi:uncharacterized membrane protein